MILALKLRLRRSAHPHRPKRTWVCIHGGGAATLPPGQKSFGGRPNDPVPHSFARKIPQSKKGRKTCMMELLEISLDEIYPYEKNPRKNDDAVDAVAESISQTGYNSPIVLDEKHVILAGHTRFKALKKLQYEKAKCIVVDGLSEDQKKKFRILDNKTQEFSQWDIELLAQELQGLDFEEFDFGFSLNLDPNPEGGGCRRG